MSSPTTQTWDEKVINTGTQHMLMNRGLWMGIIQPYDALETWQGWPFYLAKRMSGQPLGTDIVLPVWVCQRDRLTWPVKMVMRKSSQSCGSEMLSASDTCSDSASLHICRTLSACEEPILSCTNPETLSAAPVAWATAWALCWPLFSFLSTWLKMKNTML